MWSDIASVATAVGVLAAVVQLVLSGRQSRAAFEHEFVRRYWEISDDRVQRGDDRSEVLIKRYLRLCEDEFEVMRLGSISWRTWEVWHDAVREECAPFKDLFQSLDWLARCSNEPEHHPGFDCPSIFESSSAEHSKHLSARWRSSVSRWWFIVGNAIRRWLYDRGSPRAPT